LKHDQSTGLNALTSKASPTDYPVVASSKAPAFPAQAIIDNAGDGYTAEQIATEIFDNLPLERVRGVLRFA
jgi:hypothetical protein